MKFENLTRHLISCSLLFAVTAMTTGSPAHAALWKNFEISGSGFQTHTGYTSPNDQLDYSYVGIQWAFYWIDTLGGTDGHSTGPGIYAIDVDAIPFAIGVSEGVQNWLIAGSAAHWKKEWGEDWETFDTSGDCYDSRPSDLIPCPSP